MEVQALVFDTGQAVSQFNDARQLFVVDAEFVFRQTGSDIGVGMRADVWIDAEAYRGDHTARKGKFVYDLKLGSGLDVETGNSGVEGEKDLLVTLANSRIHNAFRGKSILQRRPDLSPADAVRTESATRNLLKNLPVKIGFNCVVDVELRIRLDALSNLVERTAQQRQVIVVERCPQRSELFNRELSFKH